MIFATVNTSPRPASGALHRTGGYLKGFTHTLQPYIGCRFGCDYCYVQGMTVHRFFSGGSSWGEYVHPREGVAEKLRSELRRHQRRGDLDSLAIFMSSTTDPYQGAERQWQLTRACLESFVDAPPGLLVVQTHSPLVERDFDLLRELGNRCWLSLTLETDQDDVRQVVTPRCPSIERRLRTMEAARTAGIQLQAAVSPCLPYSSAGQFGQLLIEHSDRVVVDSYVSGDGQGGKRTARTGIPHTYDEFDWGDWRSQDEARALYEWLHDRLGDERVGWSQHGFTSLAQPVTGAAACS